MKMDIQGAESSTRRGRRAICWAVAPFARGNRDPWPDAFLTAARAKLLAKLGFDIVLDDPSLPMQP